MHKTLPTLENEKEQYQIKFHEKSSGKLIFLRATKNRKCSISLPRLGKCSKSKAAQLYNIYRNLILKPYSASAKAVAFVCIDETSESRVYE